MEKLRERLTFANVVSVVALFIAMGGSAWAVAIGRNDVGAPEIARNAVGTSELKNNKTKGTDVDESSLGQVPSATSADSASTAASANTADEAVHASNADNSTTAASLANGAGGSVRVVDSATVSVDFVTLGPGVCNLETLSGLKTAPGDSVVMTPPDSLPFGVLTQAANATPTESGVFIEACNVTAATQNPPAGNYRFLIIR